MCASALKQSCHVSVCQKTLLVAAAIVCASGSVRAEDHFWSSLSGGSFNYWLNWIPNWVPQEDDRAIFELGMDPAYEVTFYESVTNDECLFRTDKVILNLNGFTYTLDDPGFGLIVGEDAEHVAEVLFHNGTIDATQAHVGLWDDSVGVLDLEYGLTLSVSDQLVVGNDGDGFLYVRDGASVIAEYADLGGHDFGNHGDLTVEGPDAEFTVHQTLRVGVEGYGYLHLQSGSRSHATRAYVGDWDLGYGELYVTLGAELVLSEWLMTGFGQGLLEIREAGRLELPDLSIGGEAGGVGQVDLFHDGSRIDAARYIFVGDRGFGTMNVSQEAAVTAESILVGSGETAEGEMNVSGHGTTVTVQNNLASGLHGVGTINITNRADVRTTTPDGWIKVGEQPNSDGYVLVDGGSTLTAENAPLVIGDWGSAAMDILDGSVVHTSGELFMAWAEAGVGQLIVRGEGSTYTSDSGYPAIIGDAGEARLTLEDGGAFQKPGACFLGVQSTGIGTVSLSGEQSVFTCEQLSVGEFGAGTFDIQDGRVALGNVDPAGVPSGEMHLAGYYTQLTGTGTVTGNVVNLDARVMPGGDQAASLTGVLTIDGDYTQQDGRLAIKVKGTVAGAEYGVLHVTGAARLDGTLHIEPMDDFVPLPSQSFTVMTFGSRTGEFAAVTGLDAYDIAYTGTSVTLTVPIPGDLNGDGTVDHEDYILFADCLSGPNVPYPLGCDRVDLHTDGDVDAADFAEFQTLYGAGR